MEIGQTWAVMDFSYEPHYSTGTPLLKSDENLIETLEDNQVMTHIQDCSKTWWLKSCYLVDARLSLAVHFSLLNEAALL